MQYIYTAVIQKIVGDDGYIADVPDMRYCTTSGSTFDEAIDMVQDALAQVLITMEDEHALIPEPTSFMEIAGTHDGQCVNILVDTRKARAASCC